MGKKFGWEWMKERAGMKYVEYEVGTANEQKRYHHTQLDHALQSGVASDRDYHKT
jgi:hypothetical protein